MWPFPRYAIGPPGSLATASHPGTTTGRLHARDRRDHHMPVRVAPHIARRSPFSVPLPLVSHTTYFDVCLFGCASLLYLATPHPPPLTPHPPSPTPHPPQPSHTQGRGIAACVGQGAPLPRLEMPLPCGGPLTSRHTNPLYVVVQVGVDPPGNALQEWTVPHIQAHQPQDLAAGNKVTTPVGPCVMCLSLSPPARPLSYKVSPCPLPAIPGPLCRVSIVAPACPPTRPPIKSPPARSLT